uniref:Uncharacterized protein n=1 Tax=Anguilla anguilla TaxID=7936 RepID=A0A0E9QPS7_ANGAN
MSVLKSYLHILYHNKSNTVCPKDNPQDREY